jgi:SAM-dependent methyltransferase
MTETGTIAAPTVEQVLDGYDAMADLYPWIPSMILWRGWEYAIYRRCALPGPVLDVGCGDGRFFRHVFPECRDVVGVDENEWVVAAARASGVYREVHQLAADRLPVGDERFQSAFANCSLEHMDNLPAVLQGIADSLMPGGNFLCSVVTEKFVEWSPIAWVCGAAGDEALGRAVQQGHERYHHLVNPLTVEAWSASFAQAGFVELQHLPILPEMTARLFLVADQIWHLPREQGEWGDLAPAFLQRFPNFHAGFRTVLHGLLQMERDPAIGAGAVFIMRKPR